MCIRDSSLQFAVCQWPHTVAGQRQRTANSTEQPTTPLTCEPSGRFASKKWAEVSEMGAALRASLAAQRDASLALHSRKHDAFEWGGRSAGQWSIAFELVAREWGGVMRPF